MLLMLVKPHNTNLNPRLNSIHNAPREGRQTTSFLIRTTFSSFIYPNPHPRMLYSKFDVIQNMKQFQFSQKGFGGGSGEKLRRMGLECRNNLDSGCLPPLLNHRSDYI